MEGLQHPGDKPVNKYEASSPEISFLGRGEIMTTAAIPPMTFSSVKGSGYKVGAR